MISQLAFLISVLALGLSIITLLDTLTEEGKNLILERIREMSWKRVVLYLILIIFSIFIFLPIWGAITTSLKTSAAVAKTNPLTIPTDPTLHPYTQAFNDLKTPLLNSALITIGGVAGSVILGSMCAFIFSKYRFKYDTFVFVLLAIGTFLPYQSILVPLYQTISTLGLYGKVSGLILTHTAYGIPVCAVLFRSFYGAIPKSVVEQAKVDGAGTLTVYTKIVLPSTIIATVTVVIYQFTSIWNDFLFGLVLGGSAIQARPAPVALYNLKGSTAAQWNVQMAGAMIVALPIIVLFIVLGKYLVRGYMSGAISG